MGTFAHNSRMRSTFMIPFSHATSPRSGHAIPAPSGFLLHAARIISSVGRVLLASIITHIVVCSFKVLLQLFLRKPSYLAMRFSAHSYPSVCSYPRDKDTHL